MRYTLVTAKGKAVELFARAIERAHKIGGNDE